ncbi:glycosyltransferase involved in cell wall biosynthesis [Neorhizobium sp. 2083]|uniref:glycosyltransferase family 4 protein n=1 Tax=Neorhizobium sp. 2083 TaxID=2817762 RepID=UPI00285BB884|nr:glycosyltransferase family 4 protein [Neorhizobium sp. 2083]MDR6820604.1 glycosyltransferase involved in cell wall biosynthesis [Neorhizobium sp. 2083]
MSVTVPDSDSLLPASRAWPSADHISPQRRTENGAHSSITKSPGKALRPLLIAEAANPEWTSVPLVGWNLAHAIMQRTDALLVTQIRNRDALLRAGLVEERDFIAIDNERVARAFYRLSERLRGGANKGWTVVTALSSFSYYSFEREVWRLLGKRLMAGEFDLVHRITPLSPTSQSPIVGKLKKYGIPFVLGPLNGGVPWPKGFSDVRSREREWLSAIRKLHFLMPSYRATRSEAAALIAGSRHTLGELPASCAERAFLIPENAADPERFPFQLRELSGDRLAIAFIGRLVPYKGADVLIEAVAAYRGRLNIEVLIVGDGPQRKELEETVRRKGLWKSVKFAGWVEQRDMASTLAGYHVLALPSVREFGGGVVLEAMSMGLVPIVANYGGPPELIDDQSGIAVDFQDRESLIAGFTKAFEYLEINPGLVSSLSNATSRRVRKRYSWQAKAAQMTEIYNWILYRGPKPIF